MAINAACTVFMYEVYVHMCQTKSCTQTNMDAAVAANLRANKSLPEIVAGKKNDAHVCNNHATWHFWNFRIIFSKSMFLCLRDMMC
jgi:hypothetical protein